MSADSQDAPRPFAGDAARLLARAASADRRREARLATAIDDFFLVDDDRLDDRTRASLHNVLSGAVRAIEREIAGHAARQLAVENFALSVALGDGSTLPRLIDSGLLRDPDVMDELLGQVRLKAIGESLLANRAPGAQPALLSRLATCEDSAVALAARDYLLADSGPRDAAAARRGDLSANVHTRLVWWVAAALRERLAAEPVQQAAIDRALEDAGRRTLATHDDGDGLDHAATRLAAAIDARAEEVGELLVESLSEGLAALFVAVTAHALRLDFPAARALTLDPDGDRLWLAMRALGLDRVTIAQIGLALADADSRRDIEAFADQLDTIETIPTEVARAALAPLSLNADFRAALRALGGGRQR